MKLKALYVSLFMSLPAAAFATQAKSTNAAANLTRACIPKIGDVAITLTATTSSDADSGALNLNSLYRMACTTDMWIRYGAAAVTAASGDELLFKKYYFHIPTGGTEKLAHISVLAKDADGTCQVIECR